MKFTRRSRLPWEWDSSPKSGAVGAFLAMRTRTKLLLMIGTVVAGFIIFLGSLYGMNRKLDRTFIENSRAEKAYQISKTIDFCSRPLLTLVTDYSLWDDMITFAYHPTDKWAMDNILPGLPAHHIDVVWIMDTTETVRYSLSQSKDEPLAHDTAFVRSLRRQIEGNPWAHYFTLNSGRLVEVRSAPMQPSDDIERKSRPRGFFVAADVWDDSYLHELSDALQARLVLSARPDTLASGDIAVSKLRTSEFTVHQELLGPDGHEIAALLCTYASPTYAEMHVFVDRLLLGGLIFGVAIMLLLVTTLTHWVGRPLTMIMDGLKSGDAKALEPLERAGAEFRIIGSLGKQFFRQNEELKRTIEDLRLTEVALRLSEDQIHSEKRTTELILESAGEGICRIDQNGRVTYANETARQMLGCGPGELLGDRLHEYTLDPSNDEDVSRADDPPIYEVLRDGQVHKVARELFWRADGGSFPVEYVSAPIVESGQRDGAVIVFRDISERRKAEEQLSKLWQAMEQSPAAIIITDIKGRIEDVNSRLVETIGYTSRELLGKELIALQAPSRTHPQSEAMWQTLRRGGSWRGEWINRRKNGTEYWVLVSIAPVVDFFGEVAHFVAIQEDITDRKLAEEQLHQAKAAAESANRAKSSFLASMSHEIRTPMNAILGYSQLLTRDSSLSAEAHQQVSIINRSGEHLLELINDILEMSKIEAGRITFDPDTFNLLDMLNDLGALFSIRAQSKRLAFSIESAPGILTWVKTDEGKLRQILINLLGNAIKFTGSGSIRLRAMTHKATNENYQLVIDVHDTGAGIAENELHLLFKRFGQTESGRKTQGGTGLGLAISREYARLMGGDITVESTLNKGSVFHLAITIQPAEGRAISAKAARRKVVRLAPSSPRRRVLITDDQQANRDWLEKLLVSIGFEVRQASSGQEALEIVSSWQPHLILMDMRMPDMSGPETTREIRRRPGGQGVTIFAVTASAFKEDIEAAMQSGMDAFLSKPLKIDDLLEKIPTFVPVEYEYGDSGSAGDSGNPEATVSLINPEEIEALPRDLVLALIDATTNGVPDRIQDLVSQVGQSNPKLAASLLHLVDQFEYDRLLELFSTRSTSSPAG